MKASLTLPPARANPGIASRKDRIMATAAFEEIAETFDFLDDWEDRYRHVIELGKAMPPMDPALQVPATKVEGCASQVWIMPMIEGGRFDFQGDSDALIVRGLIAVLHALYAGVPVNEIDAIDAQAELGRLGLDEHLSSQRSNGLRAMVARIRQLSAAAA
jgi:cysteine desulfuration protein SufE|tara:strand:- start:1574 stop:2053 length:480 start_codon:yes stop_codon:yes gene_type:complete